jgi:hypothetical protein
MSAAKPGCFAWRESKATQNCSHAIGFAARDKPFTDELSPRSRERGPIVDGE